VQFRRVEDAQLSQSHIQPIFILRASEQNAMPPNAAGSYRSKECLRRDEGES
jgi:hypothetical protein